MVDFEGDHLGEDCIKTPPPPAQQARPIKLRDKLAIVGWAQTTREQAPWDDPAFDIWGVNELGIMLPGKRWTAWFNLHARGPLDRAVHAEVMPWLGQGAATLNRLNEIPEERVAWLAEQTVPVYMLQHWDDIPMSQPFPFSRVFRAFGNYMTSTIAYELALALLLEYKEIHLYGIDMATDSEYWYQRPCVEWLLGVAMGRGIKVHIPRESSLFKAPFVYALEDPPGDNDIVSRGLVQKRIKDGDEAVKRLEANLNKQIGRQEVWREIEAKQKIASGRVGLPIRWE